MAIVGKFVAVIVNVEDPQFGGVLEFRVAISWHSTVRRKYLSVSNSQSNHGRELRGISVCHRSAGAGRPACYRSLWWDHGGPAAQRRVRFGDPTTNKSLVFSYLG